LDLGKVAMGVLGKVKGVVGSRVSGLQIAEEGIDRTELLHLYTSRSAAGHDPLLRGSRCRDCAKAPQAIGHHLSRSGQRYLRPFGNRLLGEFQSLQADLQRPTRFRRLHGRDERHLVLRAAPALAARQFTAQVSVVDLDPPIQLARFFPLAHDLHQLVLEQPGGLVAHAQMALEFERQDIVLGLRQQVHGQEPSGQRQLGGLKDRPAHHRRLLPACRTLPVGQPLPFKRAMTSLPTLRADESARPTQRHHRSVAFLLRSVALHELRHRQTLLKLHFVDPHHASPSLKMRPFFTPSGSPNEPAELCG
jgi:hypothetical protein